MIDCCHRTSVAKVQPEINYYLNGTLKEVTSGVLARGPRALSERKQSWRTNSRSTTGTVASIHIFSVHRSGDLLDWIRMEDRIGINDTKFANKVLRVQVKKINFFKLKLVLQNVTKIEKI